MHNLLIEHNPDAIFAKDRAGRYIFANRAAADFLQRSVDDIVGCDDTELFNPQDAALLRGHDRQVMDTDRPMNYEASLNMPDGQRMHFLITKGPLHDEVSGEVIGIFAVARNMTQLRVDAPLRTSQGMEQLNQDTHIYMQQVQDLQRTCQQLQTALNGERDISISIGIYMMQYHLDREAAFDVLRRKARSQRRKLADFAKEIVQAAEIIN